MKTSYDESRRLPAIACSVAELENLVGDLREHFNEPRVNLTLVRPGQDIEFDDFEELKTFSARSVTTLAVRVWEWGEGSRSVTISSRYSDAPSASVNSSSEAWNASILGLCQDFARRHRNWYWRLRSWIPWTLFTVLPWASTYPSKNPKGLAFWIAVASIWVLAGYLTFRWEKVFPSFVVRIRREENWVRKHQAELVVIGTLVSAAAAVIAAIASLRD